MDLTPFWSSPEFTKAMTTAAVGLATLIGSAATWFAAQAIYRRVLTIRARKKGERAIRYRRAEDDWRKDVQRELASLRADFDERVPALERGMARLQGMASALRRKVDEAGDAMKASAKDMRETREQVARFMGQQDEHQKWLREWRDEVNEILRGRR